MVKNINLLLNFWEKKLNRPAVLSKPWKIFIEVSLSCNLRCITCAHSKSTFGGIMKDETFEHIKPVLASARVIHEVGYGEPLLNKTFVEKLRYLKQSDIFVDIYSNGMLLNKETAGHLVDLQLDQITFSIDGGTKETFEAVRSGANYSKVLENIDALHRIKTQKKSKRPFLRVNYVGMRRNIKELPMAIRTLSKIGIKELVLSDMSPPDPDLAQECLYYYKDVADQVIERSKKIAAQCRLNLIVPSAFNDPEIVQTYYNMSGGCPGSMDQNEEFFPNSIEYSDQTNQLANIQPADQSDDNENDCKYADSYKKYPCYEPWQTIYITYDGNVRPCCAMSESFGNIMQSSIEDIWNNKKYRLLRKTVNSKKPAFKACRHCLLRRRVQISFQDGIIMGCKSIINNGIIHTAQRALKYFSEYF